MTRQKKNRPSVDEAGLLRLFREHKHPLREKELLRLTRTHRERKAGLMELLDRLVAQGKLVRLSNGYGLTREMPLVAGELQVQRGGMGFLIPEDRRRADIYIPASGFGPAWHGDKVLAAVLPARKGKRAEGRVARVVEKGPRTIAVQVVNPLTPGLCLARPTSPRHPFSVLLSCNASEKLHSEEVVVARCTDQLEPRLWRGELVRRLGDETTVAVQEELVKLNHDIPGSFPKSVLGEARNRESGFSDALAQARRDLTDLGFVTIDGATAKDFDDAVFVREQERDFVLFVAIADVSAYVSPGSALDVEALNRGNSYYFPTSVEPMLPEALSNNLCSLRPDEPRLVMVAEMRFGPAAEPRGSRFYPAVIRSAARLTYDQVKRALLDREPEEEKHLAAHLPMLERAERLARALLAARQARGSIDFDLPEPELVITLQDRPGDIQPRERHFAHQLIEEFMLAANEAVAGFLESKGVPFLYRVHPEPKQDKLDALFSLLAGTDLREKLPEERDAKALNRLIHSARDTDLEFVVNRLLLRSMQQAGYSPKNEGHFGLASSSYCHFTSPIRRYADLVVHRSLKFALGLDATPVPGFRQLKEVGQKISALERKAVDAEREIIKRMGVLLLSGHVGREFEGVVSSVADFGFWVELTEFMVEGMVRLSTIHDDYYVFDTRMQTLRGRRTGRSFRLGQRIRVRLTNTDMGRLEADFTLA